MRDLRRSASEVLGSAGRKTGQEEKKEKKNKKQQINADRGKLEIDQAQADVQHQQDMAFAQGQHNPLRITLVSSSSSSSAVPLLSQVMIQKSVSQLERSRSSRISPSAGLSTTNHTNPSEISNDSINNKGGQFQLDFHQSTSSSRDSSPSEELEENINNTSQDEQDNPSSNSKNDQDKSKTKHNSFLENKQHNQLLASQNSNQTGGIEGTDKFSSSKTSGRWTKEEHEKFEEGLQLFGRNWKRVEEHIGTRTGAQIRSHAQKFYNRLEKEQTNNHGASDKSRELLDIMNSPAFHASFPQGGNSAITNHPPKLSKTMSSQSGSKKYNKQLHQQVNDNSSKQPQYHGESDEQISPFVNIPNAGRVRNNTTIPVCNVNPSEGVNYHNQDPHVISMNTQENYLDSCRRKISDDFDVAKLLTQSLHQPGQQLQQSPSIPQQYPSLAASHFLPQPAAAQTIDWNKFYEEYSLFDKDDSNESNDCSDGSQLRQFYEQALKNPLYNPQNQQFLSSRFQRFQLPQETITNLASSTQAAPSFPSIPAGSNNNNNNNHSHYNIEDRDSEEVIDRFLKTIQEQHSGNNNDNSFYVDCNVQQEIIAEKHRCFLLNYRAENAESKLYDMSVLGQQNPSSNSLNYKSELYMPNPVQNKARSRFGSFKLHDEENESSNLKYYNLRKASIDDHELKKKFKLNDGFEANISVNHSTSKHSADNIIYN